MNPLARASLAVVLILGVSVPGECQSAAIEPIEVARANSSPVIVIVRREPGLVGPGFKGPSATLDHLTWTDSQSFEEARRMMRGGQRAIMQARSSRAQTVRADLIASGATHVRVLLEGLAVSAWMTPIEIALARSSRDVVDVIPDILLDGQLAESTKSILADSFWNNQIEGSSNTSFEMGLLDSGIDVGHPGFPGISVFYSIIFAQASGDSTFADFYDPDDFANHGTPAAGIIMGRGSAGYVGYWGVARGLVNALNLKSGFLRTSGAVGLYFSDAIDNIDWGIFGAGDDLDTLNFSYGISTSSDDTSLSRFMDALVDDLDIPVIVSAGNSGPSSVSIIDPAIAYNILCVGSIFDQGTSDRSDDIISFSSSIGPTSGGRKKPDVVAPGGFISSPTSNWESGSDYVAISGTSFSAPHVTGAVHLIMDALGPPVNPKLIKALLINNAEDYGAKGWDPFYGWGYIDLRETNNNLLNSFAHQVNPKGQAGDFKLYSGTMGADDKVTLVWNRHVEYDGGGVYPSTWYGLNDLDLRLYDEADGTQIDSSTSNIDNVEQVVSAVQVQEVVVKVVAEDTSFAGVSAETYGLATPAGFSLPTLLPSPRVELYVPTPVAIGDRIPVVACLANDGNFSCFSPNVQLDDLGSFGFFTGASINSYDRLEKNEGDPILAAWYLEAPSAPISQVFSADLTASGFGEVWSGSTTGVTTVVSGPPERLVLEELSLLDMGADQYQLTVAVRNESSTASTGSTLCLLLNRDTQLIAGQATEALGTISSGGASQFVTWTLSSSAAPVFALVADGQIGLGTSRAVYASFAPQLPQGLDHFGAPTIGDSGFPILAANAVASVGDTDFAFTGFGAPASSLGVLGLSSSDLDVAFTIAGLDLWVDPTSSDFFLLAAQSDEGGLTELDFDIPSDASLAGLVVYAQLAWIDVLGAIRWSASDGLALTVQP